MLGEEAIPHTWPHGGSGHHHREREEDHRGPRRKVHSGEFEDRKFPWSFLHPSKCVLLSTQSTGCPLCGREQWWPERRRKGGSATSSLSRPSSPRSTSSDPDVEAFSIMTGFQCLSSTPRSLYFPKPISICWPLQWQVVTLAVYTFFVSSLMGRQFLDPAKNLEGHEVL